MSLVKLRNMPGNMLVSYLHSEPVDKFSHRGADHRIYLLTYSTKFIIVITT